MLWLWISPVWAIVGAVIGIAFGAFSLLLVLLPSFKAIIWIIRIAGRFIFYSLMFCCLILKRLAGKIRKTIYSDEYEKLHF